MIIKIMSSEDLPDDDPRKSFQLYNDVDDVHFGRDDDGGGGYVEMYFRGQPPAVVERVIRQPEGNVYVLDDAGARISVWSPCPLNAAESPLKEQFIDVKMKKWEVTLPSVFAGAEDNEDADPAAVARALAASDEYHGVVHPPAVTVTSTGAPDDAMILATMSASCFSRLMLVQAMAHHLWQALKPHQVEWTGPQEAWLGLGRALGVTDEETEHLRKVRSGETVSATKYGLDDDEQHFDEKSWAFTITEPIESKGVSIPKLRAVFDAVRAVTDARANAKSYSCGQQQFVAVPVREWDALVHALKETEL